MTYNLHIQIILNKIKTIAAIAGVKLKTERRMAYYRKRIRQLKCIKVKVGALLYWCVVLYKVF